jgi:pimeloyl-ACP methyl ester carboxylesterase
VPTLLRRGCPLRYRIVGSRLPGEVPILLIPGWGCDGGSWGDLLQRLAAQRSCIAIENRRARRPFSIATMADDAAAILDDAGVQRVDVVGNSLGGMVGQALALRHPDRVRSLVLLSTSPGVGSIPCHPALLRAGLRQVGGRLRWRRAPRPRASTPRRALHGAAALGATGAVLSAAALAGAAAMAAPAAAERRFSLSQLWATLSWFGLPVLSQIRVPTLVVHGTHDAVVPALNARLLAHRIPGARLHLIRGAGHLILGSRARGVAETIATFLESPPPGAPPGRPCASSRAAELPSADAA